MEIFLALLGAGSAGGFSTIGAAANAQLKTILDSPIASATINFVVGFSILTLLLVLGIFKPYKLDLLSVTPWLGIFRWFIRCNLRNLKYLNSS
ncbi:hypothetical protein DSM107007_57110 [Nostoc sp. PCC 7120 = FACHB-418]|uniref:DMT family transporter n=1 Tax=Nostoc sp. (strain PCC 7120 / SAG 25.82 / UTEX 2576) TaxID=103690 RepID=UPI000F96E185|nr:DMT family transporter [Nostoc sp. PCC 7120 = FACHB-418]RUR72536.1 hypothetical protein DSM107007_57110 [Nostoc sp. PCC 7120 = FACHB-418]